MFIESRKTFCETTADITNDAEDFFRPHPQTVSFESYDSLLFREGLGLLFAGLITLVCQTQMGNVCECLKFPK